MKILLAAVNAKYIHSNLAVYSLKAAAQFCRSSGAGQKTARTGESGGKSEEAVPRVEIAEFTINHHRDDILREIYEKRPDVLAFSCYIWNLEMIESLLPDVAQLLPETEIWAGGPEVSYDAPAFLELHPEVKGVMLGEGEDTFCRLISCWQEKDPRKLTSIPGIAFRGKNGRVCVSPLGEPLDMNSLPFPYGDLTEFENRIIYYESSRGCPFSCSYCLSSIEKSVRFRDVEKVKEELGFFLERRTAQVKFVDRTFNCRRSHALAIWEYIRDHDNGVTNFHFEIAADLLGEEELELLSSMRPGLVQLEIGVQSTNRETIREIDRIMDFEKLSGIVKRLQEAKNIHLHLDLIAGLPLEDYESFVNSFNQVYRLYPEQLQLGFLKVLKGSKMQAKAGDYGLVYRKKPVYEVLFTKWITYEELLRLKEVEEMLEAYYNSGQFPNTMRYLEQKFAHPFALYEALAGYYRETGQTGRKISRLDRFCLLRDFAQRRTPDRVCEEMLILDLYLRENSKSRPEWAASLVPEKDRILEFYRREEETQRFLLGYKGRSAKQMMHMTHLERFRHLGAEKEKQNADQSGSWNEDQKKPKERWLLFDYQRRDPLTRNAHVEDVTDWMGEKTGEKEEG